MAKNRKNFLLLSKSGQTRRVNKYLKPIQNIVGANKSKKEAENEGCLAGIEALFKCVIILVIFIAIIYFAVQSIFFK
jgi:hypothetical protein